MNSIAPLPRPAQQTSDAATTPGVATAPAGWTRRFTYADWHAHLATTAPGLMPAGESHGAIVHPLSRTGPVRPGPASRDAA